MNEDNILKRASEKSADDLFGGPKSQLKSLEEHNKQRSIKPVYKTGIACPNCDNALVETFPGNILLSSPPQKEVHCENCNFSGYALA